MSDEARSERSIAEVNPALATLDHRQRRRLVIKAGVRALVRVVIQASRLGLAQRRVEAG